LTRAFSLYLSADATSSYLYHCRHQGYLRLFMTKYAGTLSRVIARRAGLKDQDAVDVGKLITYDHPPEDDVHLPASENYFAVEDILRFMLDIARGLAFLHKRRIIHRGIVTLHQSDLDGHCRGVTEIDYRQLLARRLEIRECVHYFGRALRHT
jgi:hypothetical protein